MASFVPTSEETLEDQRLYTSDAANRGSLSRLPSQDQSEEEQRATHIHPGEGSDSPPPIMTGT